MKRSFLPIAVLCAAGAAHADRAHEHGVARLDIAVERQRITLQFESPLDNLVGFERAPRNAAQRQALEAALARLRDATLFRVDAAAGCRTPGAADVKPPAFGGAGHTDVELTLVFDCQDAARAASIETGLFAAFARLQRLQVQVALEKGQRGITLRRPVATIELRR